MSGQLNTENAAVVNDVTTRYADIPSAMKQLPNWVISTANKNPFNPATGNKAKSNDAGTWNSFECCEEFLKKNVGKEYVYRNSDGTETTTEFSGLGFMFNKESGIVGVDIDHCLDENGRPISDMVNQILSMTDSYVEKSQSGTGLHIIVNGTKTFNSCRKKITDGIEIEVYDNARFFYITGNAYVAADKEVTEGQALIDYIASAFFAESKSKSEKSTNDLPIAAVQIPEDVWATLETKLLVSEKLNMLWNGNRPVNNEGSTDESINDASLLAMLGPVVNYEPELMKALFLASPYVESKDQKHKKKLERADYLDRTIDFVVDSHKASVSTSENQQEYQNHDKELQASNYKEYFAPLRNYDFSDDGNAGRFLHFYGDRVLFCDDEGIWYVFNGKIWVPDVSKSLMKSMAKELYFNMKSLANELVTYWSQDNQNEEANTDDKSESDKEAMLKVAKNIANAVKKLGNVSVKTSMFRAAECDALVDKAEFNSLTDKLVVKNGIVDLKTGSLMDFSPDYKVTQTINIDYNPNAGTPARFLQFLDEIFCGDEELVEYVLCFLGYCLTGEVKESKFLVCYGGGSNGKSVFFNLIHKVLGEFAGSMGKGAVLKKRNADGPNSGLMKVRDKRFVQVSELDKYSDLDTALVKNLTGGKGEVINSREMYGSEQSFEIQFKLIINTNFLPKFNWFDFAMARRVVVIPFDRTFKDGEKDLDLPDKLEAEKEQILNLLIQKAVEYYQRGSLPQKPEASIAAYEKALLNDCPLKAFFDKQVEITGSAEDEIRGEAFYSAILDWCGNNGIVGDSVPTQTATGIVIKNTRGVTVREDREHRVHYLGLKLKNYGTQVAEQVEQ